MSLWTTKTMFVLRPAAPATGSAKRVMVGRRVYSWAFSRWSTAWTISSTNPSNPTNAVNPAALVIREVSWRAHSTRRSDVFINPSSLIHFHAEDLEHALQV